MQSPAPLGISNTCQLEQSINSTFPVVGYQPTVSYATTGTLPTTTYPTPTYSPPIYSPVQGGLRGYVTYQNSFIVGPQRTNYFALPFRYAPSYRYFTPIFDYGPYYRN